MQDYLMAFMQWIELAPEARLAVGTMGSLFLVVSLFMAYREFKFFQELDDPTKLIDELFKDADLHRGKPKKKATILAKIERIEEVRENAWRYMRKRFVNLGIYGYIIPSVLLFFVCLFYNWFDGSTAAFVRLLTDEPVIVPTLWEVLLFVFAQLSKGALLDFLEVFKLEPGVVTNNPSNVAFSGLILLFRGFVGIFSGVLVLFVYRVSRARVKAGGIAVDKIGELRELLSNANA